MTIQKTQISIIFILFALLGTMLGCKSDDEPVIPDDIPKVPTIEITTPLAQSTNWNTVSVEISTIDEDDVISEVQFYVGAEKMSTQNTAPYAFDWDTKDTKDGIIEIKAVALDSTEKEVATHVIEVNVLNMLIQYNLEESFLPIDPNFKYFTYITTDDRKVLYHSQIETVPFEAVIHRPEDFEGENVKVHLVKVNPQSGAITSYDDISPGLFSPISIDEKGEETGSATIKFKDIPIHDYFTANTLAGSELKEANQTKMSLYENQNLLYVYLKNKDEGNYRLVKDLPDGPNVIDLSIISLRPMTLNTFTESGKVTSVFEYKVDAHTGSTATSPSTRVYKMKKGIEESSLEFGFHTPSEEPAFDHFSSYVKINDGDRIFENTDYFNILTSIEKLNVAFLATNKQLSDLQLSSSGDDFDVLKTTCGLFGNDNFWFVWNSYSADHSVNFPPIPPELTQIFSSLSNANIGFKESTVVMEATQYDHLEGYDKYINRLFGREDGKGLLSDIKSSQTTTDQF